MNRKSPIYGAIQQVISLFDQDIPLYSYDGDFASLWELDGKKFSDNVCCVVDDGGESSFNWLQIGVWGAYYRAKNGSNASNLVLIGKSDNLNPPKSKENIYVPKGYEDEGWKRVSFDLKDEKNKKEEKRDFIVELYESIQLMKEWQDDKDEMEKEYGPQEGSIEELQALIYRTFSLPEERHRISNEIAPIELRKAIENFQSQVAPEKKGIIDKFINSFKPKPEQKALLALWKWISRPNSISHKVDINKYKIEDIWSIWTNAKFLLIDDQWESHSYDKIIKCVLALVTGNENITLTSWPDSKNTIKDIIDKTSKLTFLDSIINKYECLFLDLRLTPEDHSEKKYKGLSGVKIAVELSNRYPAFPIIIFSSSQQREIENILSAYGNIITCFRKPGIAGSIQAIDGNEALDNLFCAIKKALAMIENRRMVYDNMLIVPNPSTLHCKDYDKHDQRLRFVLTKSELSELFKDIFWYERYDKAFTYPFNYLEDTMNNQRQLFKFIGQIGVKESTTGTISIENGALYDKASACKNNANLPKTIIEWPTARVRLRDLDIEQWSNNNLNLNMRALGQFRNLAAHRIRDFKNMRRVSIIILRIFLDMLCNKTGTDMSYPQLENIELSKSFPLIHSCRSTKQRDIEKYIKDIFAGICYFGKNLSYQKAYKLYSNFQL